MNKFSEYRQPTVEMVLEMLERAYDDQFQIDLFLQQVSEEVIKDALKELAELAKQKKINLETKLRLSEHPEIYRAIKEIERKEYDRFISFAFVCQQIYEESLSRTYKDSFIKTQIMFAPVIKQLPQSLGINKEITQSYFDTKVQITDTYITSHCLQIPWCQDGKTYSDRLYGHVANFQSKLDYVLEEGITKGRGYEWMSQAWQKLTGSTSYDTARLLKTETVAMWSQATKDAYLDMGIEYIEIIGDAACGSICLDFVGDVVPLQEAELGYELPPYHPNCACSYVAFEEISEEEISEEEIFEDELEQE